MTIQLLGQGIPLPPDFPYRGQWLLERRIFLYIPTDEQRGTPGKPAFTAHINPTTDDWAVGFDATELAVGFGASIEDLLEANQSGNLTLDRVEADTPTGEGASVKRYIFRLGDKEADATIVYTGISGTA
jgi:hypothetical protein